MESIQKHGFCVLPYANALPLVRYIKEVYPPAKLIYRIPRSAVEALLEGRAEAALMPVVSYFSHPDLMMIPGLGVCANGDVTSVLLQCRRPLSEVRVVQLDPESRTSNLLVQVLLRDRFRIPHRIEYTRCAEEADAQVCIGDRALRAAPAVETYDLAGEWKKMTGLPFVFAVWAVRRSCSCIDEISEIVHRAKDRGCQSLVELAWPCAQRLGLPENRCYEYLADRLHYDVGPAERDGMSLFRGLAASLAQPGPTPIIEDNVSHGEGRSTPVVEWS
jgi:chorismate dehydratase